MYLTVKYSRTDSRDTSFFTVFLQTLVLILCICLTWPLTCLPKSPIRSSPRSSTEKWQFFMLRSLCRDSITRFKDNSRLRVVSSLSVIFLSVKLLSLQTPLTWSRCVLLNFDECLTVCQQFLSECEMSSSRSQLDRIHPSTSSSPSSFSLWSPREG